MSSVRSSMHCCKWHPLLVFWMLLIWLLLPKCFIHGVNILQHLVIKQLRVKAALVEQGLSWRWQSQCTTEYEEMTSELQSTQAAFTKWLEAFKRKESCQSKQLEGIQVVTQLRRLNRAAEVLACILAKVVSPSLPFACFSYANYYIEPSWGVAIWGCPYWWWRFRGGNSGD